ncbi:RtcB family protein [Neomegalonema perideroedes]|uniref:RtcB family protein n=1 Tax=Neomegalonema perideroedes TaxID=217219 RepID=UPI000380FF53|nr:RtcB family protein [Neomegalonema perideroedes]
MTFPDMAARDSAESQRLRRFYSSGAWIEGDAERQLTQTLARPGVQAVAAFPDLHPGIHGPVGAAILSDRAHPALIGGDVGCGMAMFRLDLPARRLKLDKAAAALRGLSESWRGNPWELLEAEGLHPETFPAALGTLGGGNHFCELQAVAALDDPEEAARAGVESGSLLLLVHTGSRAFGPMLLGALTPAEQEALDLATEAGADYLRQQEMAVRWAALNRRAIAGRAAELLRAEAELIADSPHNLLEPHAGGWLHRKGAAKTSPGALVPLAGSREAPSWLLKAATTQPEGALDSLAHGAGRRYRRSAMHGRVGRSKSELLRLERPAGGSRVICEDRGLLIEEAGAAYKDARKVLADLVAFGLAAPVVETRPLLTFKTAREARA